jgi:hypothetical protein
VGINEKRDQQIWYLHRPTEELWNGVKWLRFQDRCLVVLESREEDDPQRVRGASHELVREMTSGSIPFWCSCRKNSCLLNFHVP